MSQETLQLIISSLILLGVFYVAFVKEHISKTQRNLIKMIDDIEPVLKRHYERKIEEEKINAVKAKEEEIKPKLIEVFKKQEKSWKQKTIEFADQELSQLYYLLVFLFLDLRLDPNIEKEYFPKLSEGMGKDTAKMAFQVAKEILEEPKIHVLDETEQIHILED